MADKCCVDKDYPCYHDCPECNNYHSEVECDECDTMIPRSEYERHEGRCKKCYLEECFENRDLIDEFFCDNPEIKEAYLNKIYETRFPNG